MGRWGSGGGLGTKHRVSHLLLTLDLSTLSPPFHSWDELFTKVQNQSLRSDNGFVILTKLAPPPTNLLPTLRCDDFSVSQPRRRNLEQLFFSACFFFLFESPQSRTHCSRPFRKTVEKFSFCWLRLPILLLSRVKNLLCGLLLPLYLLYCIIFYHSFYFLLFLFSP